MLFDVTAVLYSLALGPVAEAFGVPQTPYSAVGPASLDGERTLAVLAAHGAPAASAGPADVPRILGAPSAAGLPRAEVAALSGAPLLQQLGLMSSPSLAGFLAAYPSAVTDLLEAPPAAREVTGWWAGLGDDARSALRSEAPRLVGNLDGIPVSERNLANRAVLASSLETTAPPAAGTGWAGMIAGNKQNHMLAQISAALKTAKGEPRRSLLTLDSAGDGKTAVVIGDLSTADYISYLVPGMFFTVDGQIVDWSDDAARIYDQQASWVKLLGQRNPDYAGKTVAVVAWMGYQTPDLTNIANLDLADRGRDAIAQLVLGLKAERAGDEPYVSIIAHSYGSTAALMALAEYNLGVDAVAVVGSPGSPAASVDDLHVPGNNVFVGEAAWDPVPGTAYFGSDPGSASYGAKPMSVDGGVDRVTHNKLSASIGHNGYFAKGSESVRNLALIGIGQGELVTDGSRDDSQKTLALAK